MSEGSRVFVCSTCYDLVDLRAELEEFIRQLGLQPVMSDRPTSAFDVAPNENSIQACLANVRSSDMMVVVLSHRYGPVLDAYGYDVSATHLEYREAVEGGKPLFLFVRDHLYAEYSIWKKNKKRDDIEYQWLKEDPCRTKLLFGLIYEHERRVQGGSTTNWLDKFQNSVDLKTLIATRLGRISAQSLLARLISAGSLPLVTVQVSQIVTSGRGGRTTVKLAICNVGITPAINARPCIEPRLGSGKELNPERLKVTPGHFGAALLRDVPVWADLVCKDREQLNGLHIMQVRYHTLTGHEIADEYTLVGSQGGVTIDYSGKRMIGASSLALGTHDTPSTEAEQAPS